MSDSLKNRMQRDGFSGYAYAYPHKSSYRRLDPTVPLADAWQSESKDSMFLYMHLPFCEFRCGFCNLFTTVQPADELVQETLSAIDRQSSVMAGILQPNNFSQIAFGGGTPSFLERSELERLFNTLERDWNIDWQSSQISFETSPATVTREKLEFLRAKHVDRVSMGVQSFTPNVLKQLGRPQSIHQVIDASNEIKSFDFPVLNLDLIYGADGQSESDWLATVERTIALEPQEIFLYPLYVRELTGLGKTGRSPSQRRRELYQLGRELLKNSGYEQHSMRLFRKADAHLDTDYRCQEDGMVGLGPGARSYTRDLHYSSEFAVGQHGVRRIIQAFNSQSEQEFATASYGVRLNRSEQQRRFLIMSLLHWEGVSIEDYRRCFGSSPVDDFPELNELVDLGLGTIDSQRIRLNSDGLSWSDVIGPWLYSGEVASRMAEFELV